MANEDIEVISTPSYNPADTKSYTGFIDFLIDKILFKIEKVAPAQVISYDRTTNRAQVQILYQNITSTGEKLTKAPLQNIPVLMLNGGGFSLSFPVKENDTGWVIAADRDISVFKQLLNVFAPNTYRKHQYVDSFFIPDKVNGFEISEGEADAVLLTSTDGNTKISISQSGVNITSGLTSVNGAVNVSQSLTAAELNAQNGANGTFTNSVTVVNGIVTGGS